jgi:hypothetical protein
MATRIIFIKPSKDAVVFESEATTAVELSNELVSKKYVTQADFEGKKLYEALSQTEMNGGKSTLPQPKNYKYQGVEAASLIFSLREKDVDKKIKSGNGNTDFDVVSITNGIAEKYDELGNLFRELATALGNQKTQASGLPADVDLFGNEEDPYFTGEEEDEEAGEDEDYDD